ncbi:MerR family transcriptional regulator [Oceanotoga sp. DSM 15011]|uniref:DNA-binding transcriptional MerR regulator n=1 Tax=Oceanotoga teriensis TaxID=515440 RepID=A0AA45C7C2_9BACT|nr:MULTISPECIES: MerR family transcriptional regulator [Oceanotoga]MDO7977782.1 MerR family transcriptional regulator [Oceanotoga teriensis]PWJ95311.1 DNA-binding transcriptional MerR regulator [Oceanotoga teriensis]UYP00566.1 MerR family transcriptional regulator [Oceanotoga sp. DSM 15011]
MENYLTIGELSKLTFINRQTILYYEKCGLIKPKYKHENNYRYYSYKDMERIEAILILRRLDFSIKEIKEYFLNEDMKTLKVALKNKKKKIKKEILTLLNKESIIDEIMDNMDILNEKRNEIHLETIEEINYIEFPADYKNNIINYNKIKEFNQKIEYDKNRLKIKSIMFFDLNDKSYKETYFGFIFDKNYFIINNIEYKTINKKEYLTYYFFETEEIIGQKIKEILKYIKDKKYQIIDTPFVLDTTNPFLINTNDRYFGKLCIPVKKLT